MKKAQIPSLFRFALIIGLALASTGCTLSLAFMDYMAYQTKVFSEDATPYAGLKGYMLEVSYIEPGGSTTPVSLPENILFELRKKLRQKGILASTPASGKILMVDIVTEASSPPFGQREAYDEIRSRIRLTDIDGGNVIPETTVYTHNPFGRDGDFAEITHAGQIASFLEYVVR